MPIKPLTGQVLVEELSFDNITTSGLVLPDIAADRTQGQKERPRKGRVLALGKWKQTKTGKYLLPEIKVGDLVLLNYYVGQKLTRNVSDKLFLVRFEDVLAVLDTVPAPSQVVPA